MSEKEAWHTASVLVHPKGVGHFNLGKPFIHGPHFVPSIIMLEHV